VDRASERSAGEATDGVRGRTEGRILDIGLRNPAPQGVGQTVDPRLVSMALLLVPRLVPRPHVATWALLTFERTSPGDPFALIDRGAALVRLGASDAEGSATTPPRVLHPSSPGW